MSVVGNQYIDIFLTAGLGTHRVHHVLPNQASGFANIISEWAVKEVAKEYDIKWVPTKNFVFQRLPKLIGFYILAPGRLPGSNWPGPLGWIREVLSVKGVTNVFSFVILGFLGLGSI